MTSQIKAGCCGLPQGKEKCFQQFKLVEIQQTFYRPPSIRTVKKWREDAPPNFEFSLKAWQLITHLPLSPENVENMNCFFTNINRGDFIFAWEPRGEWSDDIITALCQGLDLTHCVNPLEKAAVYGKAKYFRLHGGRSYRHRYTDDELARLWELSSGEAYVLFNNITMRNDALRFKELTESKE